MIRFADSCAWWDTGGNIKYVQDLRGFGMFPNASGRNGQYCYWAFDCAATYTIVLNQQQHFRNSFSLLINLNNPIYEPERNIWSWSNGGICVATLTLGPDNRLRIYVGGDGYETLGALAYTSQTVLTVETWYSIDLDWYFPSTGKGWCSLYINDVLDTATPGVPSANGVTWPANPDRFALVMLASGSAQTGHFLCDLVVSDGQGAVNNQRLGPCEVKMYVFTSTAFAGWGNAVPATLTPVEAVSVVPPEPAPNLGATYITSGTPANAYFSVPSVDCYAAILGVALSACALGIGSTPFDYVVLPNPRSPSPTIFGSALAMPVNYSVTQGIIEQFAGVTITDGAIQNAWWGLSLQGGTIFVCQLVLEKVTTRRNVPFQCGKLGSYAYSGTPSVAV